MIISNEFKKKVIQAMLDQRPNFEGSDNAYANSLGLSASIYSRLKKGEIDGLVGGSEWIRLARELGVSQGEDNWKTAKTDVFRLIEEDILFCKEFSKSRMCAGECGIGKTFTAKYLSRTLKNCFFIDASQCKTKQLFIRAIAKVVGVDTKGKYAEVKENMKYYLKMLQNPIIIVDEAGDLEYPAFLELKELWNATEGSCGWYLMGADAFRHKIAKCMNSNKVGYKEIFSRYSENYTTAVPTGKAERQQFYKKLLIDVLSAQGIEPELVNKITRRCLENSHSELGGLRRAHSLLILYRQEQQKAA